MKLQTKQNINWPLANLYDKFAPKKFNWEGKFLDGKVDELFMTQLVSHYFQSDLASDLIRAFISHINIEDGNALVDLTSKETGHTEHYKVEFYFDDKFVAFLDKAAELYSPPAPSDDPIADMVANKDYAMDYAEQLRQIGDFDNYFYYRFILLDN